MSGSFVAASAGRGHRPHLQFQRLEFLCVFVFFVANDFPMLGTFGCDFSNVWKNGPRFFQGLELFLPNTGKILSLHNLRIFRYLLSHDAEYFLFTLKVET